MQTKIVCTTAPRTAAKVEAHVDFTGTTNSRAPTRYIHHLVQRLGAVIQAFLNRTNCTEYFGAADEQAHQ